MQGAAISSHGVLNVPSDPGGDNRRASLALTTARRVIRCDGWAKAPTGLQILNQEPTLKPTTPTPTSRPGTAFLTRIAWRLVAASGGIAGLAMTGCESDSFIDPSVIGRWEHTPTKVPILERIASIEEAKGDLVEHSAVTPEDLYADPRDYRVGPGDGLQIEIWDFVETGRGPEIFERVVDPVGMIEMPQLGRQFVGGKSVEQVRDMLVDAMKKFIADPLVGVVVKELRQQTFTIVGAVDRPGPYFIPSTDYKLLEAITAGGRIDDKVKEVYVIRQVPLDERAMSPRDTRRSPLPSAGPTRTPGQPADSAPKTEQPKSGESLIDLIDQLSQPKDKPEGGAPATPAPRPQAEPPVQLPDSPGVPPSNPVPPSEPKPVSPAPQPTPTPPPATPAPKPEPAKPEPQKPPVDLPSPGMMDDGLGTPALARRERRAAFGDEPSAGRGTSPTIDLPDPSRSAQPASKTSTPQSSWVFIDGKWVQLAVGQPAKSGDADKKDRAAERPRVVAQRVIRVPYQQLIEGDTSLNIVIRPGDVIRIPALPRGEVYIAGQVVRPGVYNLSETGRLTLLRAVTSASGGLSNLAIPERVDLVRVVGDGQQAMIRLDMRAIAEGTQPDVYLKPDDMVNVGTNFWAFPLAVLRNGFRMNYGWGLVVDRNFGSDIFGVPPESQGFNGF